MGHDLIAGELSDELVDRIREKLDVVCYSMEEWDNRLADCEQETYVATLRRSAYDQHNRVIYVALGADHLYHGCSGIGEALTFTHVEIKSALKHLPYVVADTIPPIDTTEVDAMMKSMRFQKQVKDKVKELAGENEDITIEKAPLEKSPTDEGQGIKWEIEFLTEIDTWMRDNNKDKIRIYFG